MAAPHILVVDDDRDVADMISEMLEASGYRVTIAAEGVAMRLIMDHGDPVDAIILDAILPGESGASLARYADEMVPVIVCSGSPEAIDLARKEGFMTLDKPFRRQELRDAVEKALPIKDGV